MDGMENAMAKIFGRKNSFGLVEVGTNDARATCCLPRQC